MIAGTAITIIGAGILTTIGADTSTVKWASYMVINCMGIGMTMKLPYAALQAVLEYVSTFLWQVFILTFRKTGRCRHWKRYLEKLLYQLRT